MSLPPEYYTPDTVERARHFGQRNYRYNQGAPLTWAEFFSAEEAPHPFRGSLYDAYLKGWHWSADRHAGKYEREPSDPDPGPSDAFDPHIDYPERFTDGPI